MSDMKSWSGIGEEIRDAVDTTLKTGNFREIGRASCRERV